MSTWHQRRGGMRGVWKPDATQWKVVVDPPNAGTGVMMFTTASDAQRYADKVPHSTVIPPQEPVVHITENDYKIVRRHYGLNRRPTQKEVEDEFRNLARKIKIGMLDTQQEHLAAALDVAGRTGARFEPNPPKSRGSTLRDAKQVASQLGMTVSKTPHGEYRATYKGVGAKRAEELAAYETDADAIIGTMRAMALHGPGTAHRKPSIHEGHEAIGYDGQPYGVGDRVELHPGTDLWMKGARYGTVVSMSLTSADQVKVELDKMPNRLFSGPGERFKRID